MTALTIVRTWPVFFELANGKVTVTAQFVAFADGSKAVGECLVEDWDGKDLVNTKWDELARQELSVMLQAWI
jgi:hypothetical protein